MLATVEFADGYICDLELIYNWDRMHMYRSEDCYLLVPYKDVVRGVVQSDVLAQAIQEAKQLAPLGATDIGKVLYSTSDKVEVCKPKAKEDKCRFKWAEVKGLSSSE